MRNLVVQHAEDVRRAERMAELALQLHDSAREAGAIKPARGERQLLWTAAMAHDIGTAVDCDGSAGHARYLLLNSELYGFTPREVALAAQIVRYQRKGTPGLDDVRSLARPGDHELVARCALLLRLATHLTPCADVAVARARLVADGRQAAWSGSDDDARLVRWALARATDDDAFRPVFKRRLVAGSRSRSVISAHRSAYARAAGLRGWWTTSGRRVTPISSTALATGIAVRATPGSASGSDAASSRCRRRRRSTIDRNATVSGAGCGPSARNDCSCSNVRTDSVDGTSGTSSASAAVNTFSDTSEIDGGQSRIATS